MTGSEWLEANAGELIQDCPLGKVTREGCNKRVAALKNPASWRGGYNYYKCLSCRHSGLSVDPGLLDYRNFQIEQEGK